MKLWPPAVVAALLALTSASCGDSSSSESAEFTSTTESSAPVETVAESTSTTASSASTAIVAECEFAQRDAMTEWLADNQTIVGRSRAWLDDTLDSWLVPAGCMIPASSDEAWNLFKDFWQVSYDGLLGAGAIVACEHRNTYLSPIEQREAEYAALTENQLPGSYGALSQGIVLSFLDRWDREADQSYLEEAAEKIYGLWATTCQRLLQ